MRRAPNFPAFILPFRLLWVLKIRICIANKFKFSHKKIEVWDHNLWKSLQLSWSSVMTFWETRFITTNWDLEVGNFTSFSHNEPLHHQFFSMHDSSQPIKRGLAKKLVKPDTRRPVPKRMEIIASKWVQETWTPPLPAPFKVHFNLKFFIKQKVKIIIISKSNMDYS